MKSPLVFLREEQKKYRALSEGGRRMLWSYLVFVMAQPLLGVFVQAYVWRETHNSLIIAAYYGAFYATLPFSFFLNGKLLRYQTSAVLYGIGCFLQGLVPLLLIFFHATDLRSVVCLGIVYGIAGGFFWANNNLLSLLATTTHDRLYYNSLSSFAGTLIAIVIPALTGYLLILGEKTQLYGTNQAYLFMSLVGFLLSMAAGWIAQSVHIEIKPLQKIFLTSPGRAWHLFRLLDVIHGFYHGIESVLPVLILLILVGNEATLGSAQSCSELLAAIVIYFIGSFLTKKYRLLLLGAWVVGILFASGTLALWFTPLAALFYFITLAFTADFRWVALIPIMYDVIDTEEQRSNQAHYSYLFDRECFLNLGRLLGLGFLILLFTTNSGLALRFSLLIAAALQIFVFFLARHFERTTLTDKASYSRT